MAVKKIVQHRINTVFLFYLPKIRTKNLKQNIFNSKIKRKTRRDYKNERGRNQSEN